MSLSSILRLAQRPLQAWRRLQRPLLTLHLTTALRRPQAWRRPLSLHLTTALRRPQAWHHPLSWRLSQARRSHRPWLRFGAAAVLGLSVALSGCQSVPTGAMVTDAVFWQGMQDKLKAIKAITLSGRANVVHEDLRFSANYYYQGRSSHDYELRLTSSIGSELARLKVTAEGAQLFAEGRFFAAPSASELFAQVTPLELPLDNFHELILGIAAGDSLFNETGILVSTRVPNFEITYRNYQTVEDLSLPREIEIVGVNTRILLFTRTIQKLER